MWGWCLAQERGLRVHVAMSVCVASLLWACGAKKPELSEEFKQTLADIQEQSGKSVEASIAKQLVSPGAESVRRGRTVTVLQPGEAIWIQSGKSRVLQLERPVTRVSIADPDLAGIVVLGPSTIMINAKPLPKKEGGAGGQRGVQVGRSGVYLGKTLTEEPRLAETTLTLWLGQGIEVHSLVVADFVYEQVMLEVTVAEVNRTALEEHGLDFRVVQSDLIAAGFLGGGAVPQTLTTIPPQTNQPLLPLTLGGDAPTYAMIFPDEDVTAFIKALQTEGLATILAQPKLLAMSGQNAVFQVGGEIPIRVSSGFVADIEFKPFGTLVNFIPRVSEEGDILLTVTPEVSEPDFSQTVEGIPTFRTRRASTSARLRNGQTLIVGGLLQTKTQEEVEGVPYLKDIPVVGYAFRRTRYVKDVTELIVIVKPRLVQPIPAGEELLLPTARGPLGKGEVRTQPDDAKAVRPRVPGLP